MAIRKKKRTPRFSLADLQQVIDQVAHESNRNFDQLQGRVIDLEQALAPKCQEPVETVQDVYGEGRLGYQQALPRLSSIEQAEHEMISNAGIPLSHEEIRNLARILRARGWVFGHHDQPMTSAGPKSWIDPKLPKIHDPMRDQFREHVTLHEALARELCR